MQTNSTELAYVLKLRIQILMFLWPKSATNPSFERQDITLKAVIILLKYKGDRLLLNFGYCLQTGDKKAWKSLFNNVSALMAA